MKLRPKKMRLYKMICTTKHTVVVDVDELHNFVPVNHVSLARTAYEDEL